MFKSKVFRKIVSMGHSKIDSAVENICENLQKSFDRSTFELDKMTKDLDESIEKIDQDLNNIEDPNDMSNVGQIQTIAVHNNISSELWNSRADFDERVNNALNTGWTLQQLHVSDKQFIAVLSKKRRRG